MVKFLNISEVDDIITDLTRKNRHNNIETTLEQMNHEYFVYPLFCL